MLVPFVWLTLTSGKTQTVIQIAPTQETQPSNEAPEEEEIEWGKFEPTSYENGIEDYSGWQVETKDERPDCSDKNKWRSNYNASGFKMPAEEIFYIVRFTCELFGGEVEIEHVGAREGYSTYGIYDVDVWVPDGKLTYTMGPVWGNQSILDKYWTVYEIETEIESDTYVTPDDINDSDLLERQRFANYYEAKEFGPWVMDGDRRATATFVNQNDVEFTIQARASIFGTWWITEILRK